MTKEEKKTVIKVAHLLGRTVTEFIEDAVRRAVQPYLSMNGGKLELKIKKGFYLRGASAYEQRAAELEGRPIQIVREKCAVLEYREMMGSPYYKIVKNGSLMKVPANMIEVIGEEST